MTRSRVAQVCASASVTLRGSTARLCGGARAEFAIPAQQYGSDLILSIRVATPVTGTAASMSAPVVFAY